MGYELVHVLSDERHHGVFVCAVCQNLCGLDALVTTGCSHVFCRLCLETWLSNRPSSETGAAALFEALFGENHHSSSEERRCPTCNRDLSYQSHAHAQDGVAKSMMIGGQTVDVRPLSEVQPLAYRVLRRVKVACPLHARHGCPWQGDYGDLQDHLVSVTAHGSEEQDSVPTTAAATTTQQTSTISPPLQKRLKREDGGESNNKTSATSFLKWPFKRKRGDNGKADNADEATMSNSQVLQKTSAEMDTDSTPQVAKGQDKAAKIREQLTKRRSLAVSFKEEANGKFASGNFLQAGDLYTKALSIMGDDSAGSNKTARNESAYQEADGKIVAALRANRAAVYFMVKDYQKCVDDCSAAIRLDNGYVKAYVRRSKALTELGRFEEAYTALKEGCAINPKLLKTELENAKTFRDAMIQGREQLDQGEYAAAKATFGNMLRETNAIRVVLGAARADLGLGFTDSALRLSLQIIRLDNRCAEGYEVRGHCMYLMGDYGKGLSLLKEALRLDPDCSRAKTVLKQCRKVQGDVNEARAAVFARNFEQAVGLLTTALEHCGPLPEKAPLYGILYAERGEAFLRQKQYDSALQDCALAIHAHDDCVRAWVVKAKALHGLGRHQEALDDMEGLMRRWGSGNDEIGKAYEKADFEVRKEQRPNFYELLGVPQVASEMEIKQAYKQKAKELHPDRVSGDSVTEEQRKEAEAKFKLLGEGLEILCDDVKKQLYDEGYDQEAIRERVAAAHHVAHQRQGSYHHRYGHP